MIIIKARDLPEGMTPKMAAALVYGRERAARDLIVTLNTVTSGPLEPPPTVCTLPSAADSRSAEPLKAEPPEGTVPKRVVAEVRKLARKVAATPAKQERLVRDILDGIERVVIPGEVQVLAAELGYSLGVTHNGIEVQAGGKAEFIARSPEELHRVLLLLRSRELEQLCS